MIISLVLIIFIVRYYNGSYVISNTSIIKDMSAIADIVLVIVRVWTQATYDNICNFFNDATIFSSFLIGNNLITSSGHLIQEIFIHFTLKNNLAKKLNIVMNHHEDARLVSSVHREDLIGFC